MVSASIEFLTTKTEFFEAYNGYSRILAAKSVLTDMPERCFDVFP